MKLLVTRRDGSAQELDIKLPISFTEVDNDQCTMWQMHDAAGTDYFFNKSDGTYDGWGRAVMSNEEAEQLLDHANSTRNPPKIEIN